MSHPSKCEHGVYFPAGDEVNLGCQACNPDGLGVGSLPVMPRSSGDSLGHREEPRETCKNCGNLRTYFTGFCRHCFSPFPDDSLRGREQGMANRQQAGACPHCGSTVHYETKKKSRWLCVDCSTEYKAPKILGVAV